MLKPPPPRNRFDFASYVSRETMSRAGLNSENLPTKTRLGEKSNDPDFIEIMPHPLDYFDKILGINPYGYCEGHKRKKLQEKLIVDICGENPREFRRGKGFLQKHDNRLLIATGGGKDFIIPGCLHYLRDKLLCCRNPQKILKKHPLSKIEFYLVSFTEQNANNNIWSTYLNFLRGCPKLVKWLAERGFDYTDRTGDIKTNEVRYPKNIYTRLLNAKYYSAKSNEGYCYVFNEVSSVAFETAKMGYEEMRRNSDGRFEEFNINILMSAPDPKKEENTDYMCFAIKEGQRGKITDEFGNVETELEDEIYTFVGPTCCMNPTKSYASIAMKCEDPNISDEERYNNNLAYLLKRLPLRGEESFFKFTDRIYAGFEKDLNFICRWEPALREHHDTKTGKIKKYIGARLLDLKSEKTFSYICAADTSEMRCATVEVMGHVDGDGNMVIDLIVPLVPDVKKQIAVDYAGPERVEGMKLPDSDRTGLLDNLELLAERRNIRKYVFDKFDTPPLAQKLEQVTKVTVELHHFQNAQQVRFYKTLRALIDAGKFHCPYFEITDEKNNRLIDIHSAMFTVKSIMTAGGQLKIITPFKDYIDPIAHICGEFFDPPDEDTTYNNYTKEEKQGMIRQMGWV